MTKTPKPERKFAKCAGCGKVIPVTKKGHLRPHLSPGGVRCYNSLVITKP